MNALKMSAILAILVLSVACESTSPSISKDATLAEFAGLTESDPLYYWYSQYDGSNVTAIFELQKTKYDNLNWSNRVDTTTFNLTGFVLNPQNLSARGIMSSPRVNGALLGEVSDGVYNWSDVSDNQLVLNFGSGFNRFEADSGEMFPAIKDSVSFGQSVMLTGVSFNSNLSKSSDLNLSWSGSGEDFVHVSLTRHESERDSLPAHTTAGFVRYFSNSGSALIPSTVMNEVPVGKYNLSITKIEPKFITLSNGKRIALVGTTEHELTVNVVP